jgi:hypothetical protein
MILGALTLQCAAAAMMVQSAPLGAAADMPRVQFAPTPQDRITCATPDQWTGAARTSLVVPVAGGDDGSYAPPAVAATVATDTAWNAEFRGKALGKTVGAQRARIARQGGLWAVNVRDVGISEASALSGFKRLGVWARATGGGRLVFRTWDGDKIATKVLSMVKGSSSPSPAAAYQAPAPQGTVIDTAFMRIEGRYSHDAVSFAQSLPYGIEFYPFGTSFVARVPASLVPMMWDALDSEGNRVFLVGSSARAVAGRQVGHAAQFCGGTALLRRFPTPMMVSAQAYGGIVDIEGQRVGVSTGDVLMTIQAPPGGRGFEVGIARFTRK